MRTLAVILGKCALGGVLACWFAVSVIAHVAPLLRALQP